jgi:hypothetical protein
LHNAPTTDTAPPAREKAQRDLAQAASLAGAVFAAVVGADPFDIRHRSHWVQDIDYVAIAAWVLAVVLFLLTLAQPGPQLAVPARSRLQSATGRLTLPTLALASAVVAAALTVIALLTLPFGVALDHDFVALELAAKDRQALDRLCGTAGLPLRGSIPTSSLERPFVVFSFEHKTSRGCDDVRIPSSGILLIREHPRP